MRLNNNILAKALTLLIFCQQLVQGSPIGRMRRASLARHVPLTLRPAQGNSRGDVPGWVLITLMSAILVAGLLAIAGPALERLFNQAMDQVQP